MGGRHNRRCKMTREMESTMGESETEREGGREGERERERLCLKTVQARV
jgi:hypothetical protein